MTQGAFTVEKIEDMLSAWRYSGQLSPALLELGALLKLNNEELDKPQGLREFVVSKVEDQLQQQRLSAGLPPKPLLASPEAIKMALKSDFQTDQKELIAWSTLFFRYLAPLHIGVAELAVAIPISTRQFRRHVQRGLEQLCGLLQQSEQEGQQEQNGIRLRRFLPAPDFMQLFGVEETVRRIAAMVMIESGPRFVSIEGIGGVGKTAVAQAIAYQLAEQKKWQEILWISARQERLTIQGQLEKTKDPVHSLEDIISRLAYQLGQEQLAGLKTEDKLAKLQSILSLQSHLIIIDNLETLADTQALLPALFPLGGQTRFLLTSRYSLRDTHFVHTIPLPELSPKASQSLLESELERHGQKTAVSESAMLAIYQAIGGLPLALKLVAAQLGELPLNHILAGLVSARHKSTEQMYDFIYRHTWRLLSDTARQLLLTMLLVSPDGEGVTWMKLMSNMPANNFDNALLQLRRYSLLESVGSIEEPRYRLHRLTVTFLKTEVLRQWS